MFVQVFFQGLDMECADDMGDVGMWGCVMWFLCTSDVFVCTFGDAACGSNSPFTPYLLSTIVP
jgi:hypothetical protein